MDRYRFKNNMEISLKSTVYSLQKMRRTSDFAANSQSPTANCSRGFTLVEMIVAVALFSVVMLVCVGALLALVGANRKVHALQSVMNNLNVTLDGMVRSIRMGSTFDGSGACAGNSGGPKDCTSGGTQFSYE